ncbi:hypothetical protein [Kibdelosporangium phytohabitans]|uniref:hypothetical protein n=1 Tax=Kibdelosporangium phytohabitans TaxID=860235 RepID=UPI0012F8B1DC|nr:hypothetical protein [Kibdelosporangium phytohabitans]MBE1467447.1 hypothetical protein [Kibdelosporangium phytohabitans]
MLTRLLTQPDVRDFNLDELVVITAGTGHEWPKTLELASQNMLPLMASKGVRYIQVARRGPQEADGVDVTSDSKRPDALQLVGNWTLANEMLDGATVPQTCGDRICSQHFKAFALDTVIAAITQGQPYRHLMGYSVHEQKRATRDSLYNTGVRQGEYPLISWEWSRQDAHRLLENTFDTQWIKSACVYCPFALSTEAGKTATLEQFAADPNAGLLALAMEYTATCLNPTQGLIKGQRLLTLLRSSGEAGEVLTMFAEYLAAVPWAVYEVRRTLSPRVDGRFNYARSIQILHAGARTDMHKRLKTSAVALKTPVSVGDPRFPDDQHPRLWLRRRHPDPRNLPTQADAEHFITIAPATAVNKTGPGFHTAWASASQYKLAV